MPRLNRKTELFDRLTKIELIRVMSSGTPGSSTLSSSVAAGTNSLTVVSATNFADGDVLIVDTGEFMEINKQNGAPAGLVITTKFDLMYDHASGVQVKEGEAINLGHVTPDGATFEVGGDFNRINSAIRRLTLAFSAGYAEMAFTFGLTGFNAENFCLAFGIPESNISGAGSAADPYQILLGADNLDTAGDLGVRFTGARKDGGMVEVEGWGVQFNFTTPRVQLARGQLAAIQMRAEVTSGALIRQWN